MFNSFLVCYYARVNIVLYRHNTYDSLVILLNIYYQLTKVYNTTLDIKVSCDIENCIGDLTLNISTQKSPFKPTNASSSHYMPHVHYSKC